MSKTFIYWLIVSLLWGNSMIILGHFLNNNTIIACGMFIITICIYKCMR